MMRSSSSTAVPPATKTTGEIRVAPFDERGLHKYNGSTYGLEDINPNQMEGSTTYTLPYWLGRYHGMITPDATTDGPTSINLSLPENAEMVVGDSRSIDFAILPEENLSRSVTLDLRQRGSCHCRQVGPRNRP